MLEKQSLASMMVLLVDKERWGSTEEIRVPTRYLFAAQAIAAGIYTCMVATEAVSEPV